MIEENLKQFKKDFIEHFDKKTEETKHYVDEKSEETRRHFDVVAENLEDKIALVAEGVSLNTQKIDNLQKDLSIVKENVEIIKVDIEFIKHELKQKVGRDEFAVLEKRVSLLEAKVNQ